jgi:glycosyltransferase involved in cell wall biosynthesis
MRLGIDGRELLGRATGVGRYLAELLARWTRDPHAAGHDIVLYAPAPLEGGAPWHGQGGARVATRVVPGGGGTAWEQGRLAWAVRRDGPGVLFCPGYTAPLLAPCPVVVCIHDVSFLAHPEWFPPREGWRRRMLVGAAARRARTVLTVSEFSRSEILARLRVPASRVRTVLSGADPHPCFVRPGARQPAPGAPVARDPLVLFVGSVFNRRRLPDLIAAFALLRARQPAARLEIVGENRTFPHQALGRVAADLGVLDAVGLHDYVDEDALAALYARARGFAFLSEYEGFGFTPLEAMRAGVPAVVLDTPVAREIYKDAAVLVAPGDIDGTAAALERVLQDGAERDRLLAAGTRVAASYTWQRAATVTLEALEAAAA